MDLINVLPTATTPMSTRRSTPVPSSSQTFLVPPPSQVGFTLWTIIDVVALFEEVAQSGHEDKIAGIKSNANELGATCCWWHSKWAPLLQMFALRPFLYTPTTSSSLKEIMDEPSASSTTDPNHAGGEEGRDDSSKFIYSPQQALCLRLLAAAVAYSNGKTSTTLSSSHMKEANAKSSDTASVDAEFQAECWWPKFDDKKNKYFFVSLLNPTAKRWSLRRTGDGATALNSNNTSAAMSPAASISHHPQQQQTTQPSQVNYQVHHNHQQRITWGDSVHSRTVETSRSSSVISKPNGGGQTSSEGYYDDDGAVASSSSPRAFLPTSPAKSNSSSTLAFPPTQHLFTHVTTTTASSLAASSLAASSVTEFPPSHPPMMTLVQALVDLWGRDSAATGIVNTSAFGEAISLHISLPVQVAELHDRLKLVAKYLLQLAPECLQQERMERQRHIRFAMLQLVADEGQMRSDLKFEEAVDRSQLYDASHEDRRVGVTAAEARRQLFEEITLQVEAVAPLESARRGEISALEMSSWAKLSSWHESFSLLHACPALRCIGNAFMQQKLDTMRMCLEQAALFHDAFRLTTWGKRAVYFERDSAALEFQSWHAEDGEHHQDAARSAGGPPSLQKGGVVETNKSSTSSKERRIAEWNAEGRLLEQALRCVDQQKLVIEDFYRREKEASFAHVSKNKTGLDAAISPIVADDGGANMSSVHSTTPLTRARDDNATHNAHTFSSASKVLVMVDAPDLAPPSHPDDDMIDEQLGANLILTTSETALEFISATTTPMSSRSASWVDDRKARTAASTAPTKRSIRTEVTTSAATIINKIFAKNNNPSISSSNCSAPSSSSGLQDSRSPSLQSLGMASQRSTTTTPPQHHESSPISTEGPPFVFEDANSGVVALTSPTTTGFESSSSTPPPQQQQQQQHDEQFPEDAAPPAPRGEHDVPAPSPRAPPPLPIRPHHSVAAPSHSNVFPLSLAPAHSRGAATAEAAAVAKVASPHPQHAAAGAAQDMSSSLWDFRRSQGVSFGPCTAAVDDPHRITQDAVCHITTPQSISVSKSIRIHHEEAADLPVTLRLRVAQSHRQAPLSITSPARISNAAPIRCVVLTVASLPRPQQQRPSNVLESSPQRSTSAVLTQVASEADMDAQEIVMDAFELIVCTAPNDEPVKQHTMLSSPQRSGVRGAGRQQTHQPPTLQCIPVENAVGRSLSEAVQQLSVAPSTITPNLMTSNVGVDGLTHHYAHECFVALKASLDSPPPQHDDFDNSNVKPLSSSSSAQLNVDVALHYAASGPLLSSHYSSNIIDLAKTNFDGRELETSVRLAFVFGAKSQLATICL